MIRRAKSTNIFHPADFAIVESQPRAGDDFLWPNPETWRDAQSGRALMEVRDMSFSRADGRWTLQYKLRNFTRQHRWVYKLDAIDRDEQTLFTIVTPAAEDGASNRITEVVISRRFREMDTLGADVVKFVRRGAGQYRL